MLFFSFQPPEYQAFGICLDLFSRVETLPVLDLFHLGQQKKKLFYWLQYHKTKQKTQNILSCDKRKGIKSTTK